MRFEAAGRTRQRLSLTPVIDVVFLLLLFFMLASTFTRFAHVDIAVAGRGADAVQDDSIPLVLVSVAQDGAYAVNGKSVTLDTIGEALAEAALEGKARIVIRPSTAASAEDIIRAIEQSQAARLGPVMLVR